jgi:hypothetical protein
MQRTANPRMWVRFPPGPPISPIADVRTSYNIAADAILIDHGTSAVQHTAGLETGDPVRFSGAQAVDAEHCIFGLDGPGLDPGANVVFRFTSVDRVVQ